MCPTVSATPDETDIDALVQDVRRHLAWQLSEGWTSVMQDAKTQPAAVAQTPRRPEPSAPSAPPGEGRAFAQPATPRAPPTTSRVSEEISRTAAPGASAQPTAPIEALGRKTLDEIRQDLGDCRRCNLCEGRKQIVFGSGNPHAELVFVGEGPGADEDIQGVPFVGQAGQLLTKMIEAMGFSRDDVYICNVVKCRPPGNRNPEPDEIAACEPFLKAQLKAIQPKVIVALGKFAAQTLLRDSTPITRMRGNWREYEGIPLMPTFHPAYLLRSPGEKKHAWADLQAVMKRFGKLPPGAKGP
jgi:uracil-DNA glycosylase